MRISNILLASATFLALGFAIYSISRVLDGRGFDVLNSGSPTDGVINAPDLASSGALASSYSLAFRPISSPSDGGIGGAIAALGSDVVHLARRGRFSLLDRNSSAFREIPLEPPLDVGLLEPLVERQIQKQSLGFRDLLVAEIDEDVEITVSYLDRDPDQDRCWSIVVSKASIPRNMIESTVAANWLEIYRSQPCIPEKDAFLMQAGGALAYDLDGTLYVFVGDFGLDRHNRSIEGLGPQVPTGHIGKVISISPDGLVEVHSLGHRNPGGLTMTSSGDLLLTEHGPRGGDELNLVRKGADYGWPSETLGSHYGELSWPPDDTPGLHDRFALPVFSWVPSIAVSALAELNGAEFPKWTGDLLLATLKDRSLRRIRMDEGRVIVDERIEIGMRLRDLTVADNGLIFLKVDREPLVLEVANARAGIEAVPKGLALCAGCHQVDPRDTTEYSGPTLVGVLGREIGAVEGFDYSSAFDDLSGHWDAEALIAFLRDTQGYAPGTNMPQLDLANDLRQVLAGLKTLSDEQ